MEKQIVLIPNWIVRNLKEYGNSLLPNKLVQLYKKEDIEAELSKKAKRQVKVRSASVVKNGDVQGDFTNAEKKKRGMEHEPIYIAEVIEA